VSVKVCDDVGHICVLSARARGRGNFILHYIILQRWSIVKKKIGTRRGVSRSPNVTKMLLHLTLLLTNISVKRYTIKSEFISKSCTN
jgi:hypothetical protein